MRRKVLRDAVSTDSGKVLVFRDVETRRRFDQLDLFQGLQRVNARRREKKKNAGVLSRKLETVERAGEVRLQHVMRRPVDPGQNARLGGSLDEEIEVVRQVFEIAGLTNV